jgi:UDP-N-acetylmuramoyl-tripeptide--D-alanyl-D-alanine ligase
MNPIDPRLWTSLLFTAPGRCRLRRRVMAPATPALWKIAGWRRQWTKGAPLVAVTGSFGKTTTVRAIRAALDLPPDAVGPNSGDALARTLLLRRGAGVAVYEAGVNQPGDMRRMAAALRPDVAVVTSIGSEHSASLGTRERTRDEKFELVRATAAGGTAVLNVDDPHVRWMSERAPGRVITYGTSEDAHVRILSIALDWPHGSRLRLRIGNWETTMSARLIGDHVAMSVAAALGAAEALEIDRAQAIERLSRLEPTRGRMQIVALPSGITIIRDEYKSGLETIDRALDLLAQVPVERRIVLFGEITEPPAPQHQAYVEVGTRIAGLAQYAILLGKKIDSYRSGLRRGGMAADHIIEAGRSWRQALAALQAIARPGDVVLLKGRHDERLERIALALEGRTVGCNLMVCNTPLGRCDSCPMLRHGWGTRTPVV